MVCKQFNSFFRARVLDQLEGVAETLVVSDTGGVDGCGRLGQGIGVGGGSAPKARVKNRGKVLRERASAMHFSLPGRCDRWMVKLC